MGKDVVRKQRLDDLSGFSIYDGNTFHPGKENLDGLMLKVERGHLFLFRLGLNDVPAQ
jgi:hypothetical protein